jgi:nanoRNase/pAp phosphatase (c-di-AMP/oligoRNAs hydrolase)
MLTEKIFSAELKALDDALSKAKEVLITAPIAADGDSISSQLALRRMLLHRHPGLHVSIINDELLPHRYECLPEIGFVDSLEAYRKRSFHQGFDMAFIVDGGVDRAGGVKELFDECPVKVFIDHHLISAEYPYSIRIVEPHAASTTELLYHLSQTEHFKTPLDTLISETDLTFK